MPASVALIVTAYYLYRRRALALRLAVGLLLALTVFDVLKGLDFEEAASPRPRRAARAQPLLVLRPARAGNVAAGAVRVPLLAAAAFSCRSRS